MGSSDEAEADSGSGVGLGDADDASAPASPLHAEPLARVDPYTLALCLIARLGHPFNVRLLEQQSDGRYKRVAANNEIIVPGVPPKMKPKDIKSKVMEIV